MKKTFAALTFAALTFAACLVASPIASAFEDSSRAMQASAPSLGSALEGAAFDHCHGRATGTARWTCGSATGGPSGGLF